jgi:hypothetical protein
MDKVEEERAAVVAWLRKVALETCRYANSLTPRPEGSNNQKLFRTYHRDAAEVQALADAIERGDHREKTGG